ncbi:MAG TPA: hypothetical protein VNX68_08990 [Nitrosopumilaceae archaeon]|jgi:hypothetical protein|nr:hypothetical protein [Nitrosopumilaceae archaeon]
MTDKIDTPAAHIPEWFLADGVPGVGPKPDFLDDKYPNLAEQAKAYKEVRKALGAQAGAPDAYDFGEYKALIDLDNQHIKDYLNYARENRISQDAFSQTIKTFIEYDKSRAPNIDLEIKKLGEDGARRIETVQKWAENNLSDKSLKTIGEIGTRADVIEMLDELRQYQHHNATVLPGSDDAANSFKPLSKAEVQQEMIDNYSKYKNDAAYRASITKKFEQAVG